MNFYSSLTGQPNARDPLCARVARTRSKVFLLQARYSRQNAHCNRTDPQEGVTLICHFLTYLTT
jgi:hypothetical protein